MRFIARGALPLLLLAWTACDGEGYSDGYRSPCAGGGQILGCEDEAIETPEDACWKLVECGAFPIDTDDPDTDELDPDRQQDFAGCVDRLRRSDEDSARIAIACVEAASCDELIVDDSPQNPYEWPGCLEFR